MPILSIATFMPLIGAIPILSLCNSRVCNAFLLKSVTLCIMLGTFLLSLVVFYRFDRTVSFFQLVERASWMGGGLFEYHVGIDGISLLFVLLTTSVMPIVLLASWNAVSTRLTEYLLAFLILECLLLCAFVSLDVVMFYMCFEASLIPMFIIIGVWGGPQRVYASLKFFLYTLLGSVPMLVAILLLVRQVGSSDIVSILNHEFPLSFQIWLWLAFFAGFAVKLPMLPVHTWLPNAHVEAPTAGSAVLAALLLKLGGYGFVRFSLGILPAASAYFEVPVMILSAAAIIYASLIAFVQVDIKKLVAYSSIAHMGYVSLGIFTANQHGVNGAIYQMMSHGLISASLFLCVGMLYERTHTYKLTDYGGAAVRIPCYSVVFVIFTLANMGLPGTSGFIGEFLSLLGAFKVNPLLAICAASGVIFSACYSLRLLKNVVWGEESQVMKNLSDINSREKIVLCVLAALIISLGLQPNSILKTSEVSVRALLDRYENAVAVHNSKQTQVKRELSLRGSTKLD